MLTTTDLTKLKKVFATKQELAALSLSIDKNFVTKSEFSESTNRIISMLDAIMAELKALREKTIILAFRQAEHSDRLDKLEAKLAFPE